MYTYNVCYAIWAVLNLSFYLWARSYDRKNSAVERRDRVTATVPALAVGSFFLFSMAAASICSTVLDHLPTKSVVIRASELAPLSTTAGKSGSSFVGSGTFYGETVYQIYVENRDGSVSLERIDASDARILQVPALHARAYWREMESVRDTASPLAKWTLIAPYDRVMATWDEFDVPVGSVVQNFSVK